MTTLTQIISTQATDAVDSWNARKQEHEAKRRRHEERREALTALERNDVPKIEEFAEPAPQIELNGKTYPRIDKGMVIGALKKSKYGNLPAFAIHDVERGTEAECVVTESGAIRYCGTEREGVARRAHRKASWKLDATRVLKKGALSVLLVAWISGLAVTFGAMCVGAKEVCAGAFIQFLASFVLFGAGLSGDWEEDLPSILFKHKFAGVLPAEVREIVESLRPKKQNLGALGRMYRAPIYFRVDIERAMGRASSLEPAAGSILLVEEAYAWEPEGFVPPPRTNLDPLLVYVAPNKEWYLLAKFDLTPREDWLAQEAVG